MVINPAFHSMQVHLLMGSLFVAGFSILATIVLKKIQPEFHEKFKGHIDATIWISVGLAAILIISSIITGFFSLPIMAMLNSSIIKNKIFISLLMMLIIFFSLGIRYFYRNREFLENRSLQRFSIGLVLFTFVLGVVASSIGGDITGRSSGFEQILLLLGIQTRWTFYLPNSLLLIVLGLGIIAVILPYLISNNKAAENRERK